MSRRRLIVKGQGPEDQGSGGGQDQPPVGIDHTVSPGVACPETVLVARMTNGSYLLMAFPQGEPAAFVTSKDAGPLRQELAAAFGDADLAPNDGRGETP